MDTDVEGMVASILRLVIVELEKEYSDMWWSL